jgi:signal transduction histidine kinase
MRLPDFILANTASILAEWDAFARSVWPASGPSPDEVRDHAEAILRATAWDMKSAQTGLEQSDKSKGLRDGPSGVSKLSKASGDHALGRAASGFGLRAVMAEYRALRASVVRLWFESNPAPDRNDLADLTRFHESMDQSLAEAVHRYSDHIDRSRTMFMNILRHDLRTPLNAIALLAESYAATRPDDRESAETASQILSSTKAIDRMLNDFLDFAVSRLGRPMPVTPTPMDLAELCEEVVSEVRSSNPDCQWHLQLAGELRGEWDRPRLRQLLSNLLSNAAQHGAPASGITLSAWEADSRVHVTVHNQGAPIPAEFLPRMFEPQVRGPNAGARHGSVGLGLYIAREVAVAHQGSIEVASTEAGGTTFTVILPIRPDSVVH